MEAAARLRPARPDEAEQLSDLALRSKAHWGYDRARLEGWRAELTLPPDRIAGRLLYQHTLEQARRLGFHRLTNEADPNAEGFYRAMGAVRRGEEMRGRLPLLDAWLLPGMP